MTPDSDAMMIIVGLGLSSPFFFLINDKMSLAMMNITRMTAVSWINTSSPVLGMSSDPLVSP